VEACRGALSDLMFFAAEEGRLWPVGDGMRDGVWQLWGADMAAGRWRVDLMVERGTKAMWVYKRDASLRVRREEAVRRTAGGIAYLAPELVLLFKAKACRDKDEADFRGALPGLGGREKAALRGWLERLHPGHGWIEALG
ncbi:MAG: amino acid transporter, partial [Paracoccaceae bacterium]